MHWSTPTERDQDMKFVFVIMNEFENPKEQLTTLIEAKDEEEAFKIAEGVGLVDEGMAYGRDYLQLKIEKELP